MKEELNIAAYSGLVALARDYVKQMALLEPIGALGERDQMVREITAPTLNDLIAIEFLVANGWSSTAETLLRTQIERVATLAYLLKHENLIKKWAKNGNFTTLAIKIDEMEELISPTNGQATYDKYALRQDLKKYAKDLNVLVHCNRGGAYNLETEQNGELGFFVGPDFNNKKRDARVCNWAGIVLAYLLNVLNSQYSHLQTHYMSQAK